jgi:hypothetical protein
LPWLIAGHNSLCVIVKCIIGVSESQQEEIKKEALMHRTLFQAADHQLLTDHVFRKKN